MHRPRVRVLDESTTGLDPESRRGLWGDLREVRAHHGTTVLLTTHYLEDAEQADAVCVLAGGRIVEVGSPAQIKARLRRTELLVDSRDRSRLRRELGALGLEPLGSGPLRVPLERADELCALRPPL